MLSTSAERVFILDEIKSEKKELPQPLRFAFTMQTLLGRVSVLVESYDLIAGRAPDRLLTDEEEERFKNTTLRHITRTRSCCSTPDTAPTTGSRYLRKAIDPALHKKGAGADNALILENLDRLISDGAKVIVRTPMIPRFNDGDEQTAIDAYLKARGLTAEKLTYHAMGESKLKALADGKKYSPPKRYNEKPLSNFRRRLDLLYF